MRSQEEGVMESVFTPRVGWTLESKIFLEHPGVSRSATGIEYILKTAPLDFLISTVPWPLGPHCGQTDGGGGDQDLVLNSVKLYLRIWERVGVSECQSPGPRLAHLSSSDLVKGQPVPSLPGCATQLDKWARPLVSSRP